MKRVIAIFASIATLLISGCDRIIPADEYYGLWVSAVVVDEEGVPIQGIYAYPENDKFDGRLGYSNHLGEINAFAQVEPRKRWIVYFEDIDGEYNRGEYATLEVDITDKITTPPTTPDKWGFTGSGIVELGTVMLKRK
jgi:hypothetical protein